MSPFFRASRWGLWILLAVAWRQGFSQTEILEPSDAPTSPIESQVQAVPVAQTPPQVEGLDSAQDTSHAAATEASNASAVRDTSASASRDKFESAAEKSSDTLLVAPASVPPQNTAAATVGPQPVLEVTDSTSKPTDLEASSFTIEVDKTLGKNSDKSLGWALLAAAVVPGSGEIYLREPRQSHGFLVAELGFWGVLLFSLWSQDPYLQSARNQASQYAGLDASGKSVAFLNTMTDYRSYLEKEHRNDSYELAQILSGKRDGKYDIPAVSENFWDFGSSNTPANTQHWKSFQSTMRYYRASKVVFTFAIGGLALNRVVALAHTLRLYRHTANQGISIQAIPILGPGIGGGRLAFEF